VNKKQRCTLEAIFTKPEPSDIPWNDIQNLFRTLGVAISEGNPMRVRVVLGGVRAVFHRANHKPVTDIGAVA